MEETKVRLNEVLPLIKKYLAGQKGFFVLLAVITFAGIGLQLVSPQIIRTFIDEILGAKNESLLLKLAFLFIGIAFLQQIINLATTYFSQNLGWKATNLLRNDLTEHCMNLDMSFHKEHLPGELIERIDGDVSSLMNLFSNFMIKVVGSLFLMLGILIVLFYEDWRIGLALTLYSAFAGWAFFRLSKVGVPYWEQSSAMSADFFGVVGEQLANREDVLSSGAGEYSKHQFRALLNRWFPIERMAAVLGNSMWAASVVFYHVGTIVALAIGAYLWQQGIFSIGTVYLLVSYVNMIHDPIEQFKDQMQDMQHSLAGIKRIKLLLETKPVITYQAESIAVNHAVSVELQNVSFHYEENTKVLKNLSLALKPGEVLGVVGRTGSGKTTLGRLLLRLYDVEAGAILINGINIRNLAKESLRDQIAVVTQDVELFNTTIRDNLRFFNPQISDEQILDAFAKLGIVEWLQKFPLGLDTILQSGNTGLSAGQAQLLAFVRIFLRNPGLVILDEASSRLDPATESLIEKAIDHLLINRTAVIIAHRLWTVQRADKILILAEGEALEFDDRLKLVANPESRFSQLLKVGLEEALV